MNFGEVIQDTNKSDRWIWVGEVIQDTHISDRWIWVVSNLFRTFFSGMVRPFWISASMSQKGYSI